LPFTFSLSLVCSPVYSQNNNECVQITNLLVAVDPPVSSVGPVLGVIEISFASNGNSRKVIEVIVRELRTALFLQAHHAGKYFILQRGSTLTVTVNTYNKSDTGNGKICSSETRTLQYLHE
jgi:hypothetical protein